MSEPPAPVSPMHPAKMHFDARSPTYDQAETHHRVAAILAAGAALEPGLRVLDVATGTGLLAFEAARRVGPTGTVLGVDISDGMLAEANKKAEATGLRNVRFRLGDAERLDLPRSSFDRVLAASALVLMSDIPAALRHWSSFLKPGGMVAFDTPGEPFGLAGRIAAIASVHGIRLDYANVANTPAKCRALLEGAGLDVVAVTTELASTAPVKLPQAIAFLDEHIDHPAWRPLKEAPPATREAVRSDYVGRITAAAVGGQVPDHTALNFAYGRNAS